MKWFADLVGKPWSADGHGPAAFSCWGLVRQFFSTQHGLDMPLVAVAVTSPEADNVRAIKTAAQISGWRPAGGPPQVDDVVLMHNRSKVHCGVVVLANSKLQVLHSSHETGVILEGWAEATAGMSTQLWRHRNA